MSKNPEKQLGQYRLSDYKAQHPRLRWLFKGIRFLKWLFVIVFSFIIATNLGGGSYFTLSKFKLGSFVFPPPAVISLFAFAAVGFMLAYSGAVRNRVIRGKTYLENLLLLADDFAYRKASDNKFFYIGNFFKFLLLRSFARVRRLTKLEFFENKVADICHKLKIDSRLPDFYKKRQMERTQRFVEHAVLNTVKTEMFEEQKRSGSNSSFISTKLKEQLDYRYDNLTKRDNLIGFDLDNSAAVLMKNKWSKELSQNSNLNPLERHANYLVEKKVGALRKLVELSQKKNLNAKQKQAIWTRVQIEERDVRIQIRDVCQVADENAYLCFLKIYKKMKDLFPNIEENDLRDRAVGFFRMLRVMQLQEKIAATKRLAKSHDELNKTSTETNEDSVKVQDLSSMQQHFPEFYGNKLEWNINQKPFQELIQDFFTQDKALQQDMLYYEQRALAQDEENYAVLCSLGVLNGDQRNEYLTGHRQRRQRLRLELLQIEVDHLTESENYNLAPKSCLRLAAKLRNYEGHVDVYLFQGRWTKIMNVFGFGEGIVNAIANGFFGFLGILSLSMKLLGLPLAWVNLLVTAGALCAVMASLCLTFPRVLTVFKTIGFTIDTRGVVRTRNFAATVWGIISSIGAGLVSGSFVFLSLIVSIYFIVDQTGLVYLTMSPVVMFSGLVLGLAIMLGAAALYRPELTDLDKKVVTFFMHWWQGLKDPFAKKTGIFEKLFKGLVATVCCTAFITAAVTARVALPHAIGFIADLLFSVQHVAPGLLWGFTAFGMICSSIAIGVFVTTKQWEILGKGLGRWLDYTSFGRWCNKNCLTEQPTLRKGVWWPLKDQDQDLLKSVRECVDSEGNESEFSSLVSQRNQSTDSVSQLSIRDMVLKASNNTNSEFKISFVD